MFEFDLNGERKVIDRLLSAGPVIRYRTLVDLLRQSERESEVRSARQSARRSKEVQALLAGQRKDGTFGSVPARPEWWGQPIQAKDAPDVQPWVLKMLVEAGLSRGDEEIRRAADALLALQAPDGAFGRFDGVERVRFTADLTYALALVDYGDTADVKNAMRWLLAWLKDYESLRFDRSQTSPGRMILEALAYHEPFVLSPLARNILKHLFESRHSVIAAAAASSPVRLGGHDGLLTWAELGFRLGWPRGSEIPFQVVALLQACRNRDGSWGEKGSDPAGTLRALTLWRHLVETYGPVPEDYKLPRKEIRAAEPVVKAVEPAEAAEPAAGGNGTRDRHLRAFSRAGLEELAAELLGLLGSLGYEPDWRPMYEVHFRAPNKPCTFKLRLEDARGRNGPQLVLVVGGGSKVSLKHWGHLLGMDRYYLRYNGDQLRVVLDNTQRKIMGRLKELLAQVAAGGAAPQERPPDARPRRPRRRRGGR